MKKLGIFRHAGTSLLVGVGVLCGVACGGRAESESSVTSGTELVSVESVCAKVAALGCVGPTRAECESILNQNEARGGACAGPSQAVLTCFDETPFACRGGYAEPLGCRSELDAMGSCRGGDECWGYESASGSGGGTSAGETGDAEPPDTSSPVCGMGCWDFEVDCTSGTDSLSCVCSRGAEPGKAFSLPNCDALDTDDLRDICGSDPNPPPRGDDDANEPGAAVVDPDPGDAGCSGSGSAGGSPGEATQCSIACGDVSADCVGQEGAAFACECDNGVTFETESCEALSSSVLRDICR
jgi:hypothetical protein